MEPTKSVKIKIEFRDDSGTKYSFNIEGSSKDNINKLIDFAQTISTKQTSLPDHETVDTNFAKLYGLLESRFRFGFFTSNDVLQAYQQDFQTPTTQSVVSTYLSRLTHRGFLTRTRHGSGWIYKLTRNEQQRETMIVQTTPNDLLKSGQIPQ
ncbi:MAG: hypothetical protein ACYCPW_06690 [Nitrososphaerales archaeon]